MERTLGNSSTEQHHLALVSEILAIWMFQAFLNVVGEAHQ